jgi:hypothetical protein
MLIHELGPEDPGKEKLTVANEELSRAELAIDDALLPACTIWDLTDALATMEIIEQEYWPDLVL